MRVLPIGLGLLLCLAARAQDPLEQALARWVRAYAAGKLALQEPADRDRTAALYRGAIPSRELDGLTHEDALARLLARAAAEGSATAAHEIVRLAALGFHPAPAPPGTFSVSERATRALGALQKGCALHHVAQTAGGERNAWGGDWSPAIQAAALRGLGASGRAVFRPLLERQLNAAERLPRLAAAEALAQLALPQALPALCAALAQERDAVVAQASVTAARAILRAHPRAVPTRELRRVVDACLGLLGRTDWRTDIAAIAVLEELRSRDAIPALIETLARFHARPEAIASGDLSALLRHRAHEALCSLTGASFPATDPQAWRTFWQRERGVLVVPPSRGAQPATQTVASGFYGIPVRGSRVAFVIDVSGSMKACDASTATGERSRLDAAKAELWRAVVGLPEDAHFSVISFANAVSAWRSDPVPANEANKASLQRAVSRLYAEGGTNLFGGLQQALGLTSAAYGARGDAPTDEVFLLSDGAPSAGELTDPGRILECIRDWNRYRRIRINTVFIGAGTDSLLMRRLAEENDGTYVAL